MILQNVGDILRPVAGYAGLFMVLLGVMWLIFGLYEGYRRKSFKDRKVEDWNFKITKFLKGLTLLGFLVGLLCIIVGVVGLLNRDVPPSVAYGVVVGEKINYFTSILLVVLGVVTFIKPANDLPIATVLALIAASAITIVVALIIPEKGYAVVEVLEIKWVLVVLFIIIFALSAIVVKFFSKGFMTASKAISWPPLAIIVAIFCMLQGLLVMIGYSIVPY
ncbi:MAG: hypothetical protein JW891_02275 [Candidatus Lokiarchaeota archaeon]|nr:hypothetical protein [Candidatus Lokiarchaeota archaeon]